ncbi:Precorrin-2 dehydrogenase [Clostridiaceae bacterium JG1575]|nr:Precorrin-2 dehydrogenase [Clostridiaceae bacterium JG1575]
MAGTFGFFPFFFDLRQRRILFVGGGRISEGRVEKLLAAGADLHVIAPSVTPKIQELHRSGALQWTNRRIELSDLTQEAPFLVHIATGDPAVDEAVAQSAKAAGILVLAAGDRTLCDVWFPAIAKGKDFTGAVVSQSGNHRALKALMHKFRRWLNEEEASGGNP